ncbi:MAG: FkbM family methyltransferase [Caldimonas sp.]
MRNLAKRLLPAAAKEALRAAFGSSAFAVRSYAQEGEDLLLLRLFDGRPPAVYVDVGAHHPFRFSNTSLLHQRGWHGINIDARPGSMAAFQKSRPDDINLELGISLEHSRLCYHLFAEPALNTFDPTLAAERRANGWAQTATRTIECFPLSTVLERELPKFGSTSIGLLSVDVEGLDLEVLRSNDWTRFRPGAIVVEVLGTGVRSMLGSEVNRYLEEVGYMPYSKLINSAIFLPAG